MLCFFHKVRPFWNHCGEEDDEDEGEEEEEIARMLERRGSGVDSMDIPTKDLDHSAVQNGQVQVINQCHRPRINRTPHDPQTAPCRFSSANF